VSADSKQFTVEWDSWSVLVYSRESGLTVGSVIEALGHCADEHSGSVAGTSGLLKAAG